MQRSATNRVIYRRNPLAQVICQLRFPAILKIGTPAGVEDVARFQDRVRDLYPLVREQKVQVAPGVSIELLQSMGLIAHAIPEFVSEDGRRKVVLGRDSLALLTLSYERWEGFRDDAAAVIHAFNEAFRPAFYTRVGLRYQNQIVRSRLTVGDAPWSSLVAPHIAGFLASGGDAGRVERSAGECLLRLSDADRVQLRFGTVAMEQEQGFVIDNDFYVEEKVGVDDAARVLERLHQHSGPVFRGCITDTLHHAMEPVAVDEPR